MWTADLQQMATCLKSCGIRTVAMQSTGVYRIGVQEELEEAGLEVYLVNARGTKNLPGRKSDVQECQWLMKLHAYGLQRNSFRLPEEIRAVRTIWLVRERMVRDAGRAVQQMQKGADQHGYPVIERGNGSQRGDGDGHNPGHPERRARPPADGPLSLVSP